MGDFILPTANSFSGLTDDVEANRHDKIISEDKFSDNSQFAGLPRAVVTETGHRVKVNTKNRDIKGNKHTTPNFQPTPGTTTTTTGDTTITTTLGDTTTTTDSITIMGGMYKEDAIEDIGVVEVAQASGEINAAEEEVDV